MEGKDFRWLKWQFWDLGDGFAHGATPASSPAAKTMAASMLAGTFEPLFPIELVDKDLGYAITMAGAGSSKHTPLATAAREVFRHGIDRGMGDDNITGIVRLYTEPG